MSRGQTGPEDLHSQGAPPLLCSDCALGSFGEEESPPAEAEGSPGLGCKGLRPAIWHRAEFRTPNVCHCYYWWCLRGWVLRGAEADWDWGLQMRPASPPREELVMGAGPRGPPRDGAENGSVALFCSLQAGPLYSCCLSGWASALSAWEIGALDGHLSCSNQRGLNFTFV